MKKYSNKKETALDGKKYSEWESKPEETKHGTYAFLKGGVPTHFEVYEKGKLTKRISQKENPELLEEYKTKYQERLNPISIHDKVKKLVDEKYGDLDEHQRYVLKISILSSLGKHLNKNLLNTNEESIVRKYGTVGYSVNINRDGKNIKLGIKQNQDSMLKPGTYVHRGKNKVPIRFINVTNGGIESIGPSHEKYEKLYERHQKQLAKGK